MQRETLAWILVVVLTCLLLIALRDQPAKTPDIGPTPGFTSSNELEAQVVDPSEELNNRIEKQRRDDEIKRFALESSRKMVNKCATTVRKNSASPWVRFDAYVTGESGENVSFYGSLEDRFKFEKCMAENGQPLTDKTTGKN